MLEAYRANVAEWEIIGNLPKQLDPEQTSGVIALLKNALPKKHRVS